MKAVILCGGQGTRIGDVADDILKPMFRIGDCPTLWHIMRTCGAAGINEFVLFLGYKSCAIKEYFLNLRAHLANLTISRGRPRKENYGPAAAWRGRIADRARENRARIANWRAALERARPSRRRGAILPDLRRPGDELMLFEHHGFWQPMDTYREWRLLGDLWDSGNAPWKR